MTPTEAQRLSEQERRIVSRCARGVASMQEGKELTALVVSLARQLAEADAASKALREVALSAQKIVAAGDAYDAPALREALRGLATMVLASSTDRATTGVEGADE